jgi:hypothetical protein
LVERTVATFKTADTPVIRASAAVAILGGGALVSALASRGQLVYTLIGLAGLAGIGAVLSARRRAVAVAPLPSPRLRAAVAAGAGAGAAFATVVAPPGLGAVAGVLGATSVAAALVGRARRRHRRDQIGPLLPSPVQPLPPDAMEPRPGPESPGQEVDGLAGREQHRTATARKIQMVDELERRAAATASPRLPRPTARLLSRSWSAPSAFGPMSL